MKTLKFLFLLFVMVTFSRSYANQWEFQFKILNNSSQYQQMDITIYRYNSVSKDYESLGSGLSSTTQNWDGWNAIVDIIGINEYHPDAIMIIPLYTVYVVRIGDYFKRIVYNGYYDESFYYNTDTGSFTTGGNYTVTASGTWNESYSILLQNNFTGGNMYLNDSLFTSLQSNGVTEYREATTFPHEITAINNQQPGSYKMLWDKWTDTYANLNRELSSAQSFYETAIFKKEYKITFRNYYGSSGSTGGVIKVRGNQVNSPSVNNPDTQDVAISAEALNQTINYVDLTIDYWSDNLGTSASVNPTPNDHKTYTAYLKGKPNNGYRDLSFNVSEEGQPVRLTWSKHPLDPSDVTKYDIYRKVTTQGTPTLLTTINANGSSTYTYTDYDYLIWSGDNKILLFYDVRAYYSPSSAYADVNFGAVYGLYYSIIASDNIVQNISNGEISTDYSITNYPNPFNPTTTINYQLPQNGFVTIKVYDMLGKEVAVLVNENKSAGYYKVDFNASRLTSGVYVYTITANNYFHSKKMLLMK